MISHKDLSWLTLRLNNDKVSLKLLCTKHQNLCVLALLKNSLNYTYTFSTINLSSRSWQTTCHSFKLDVNRHVSLMTFPSDHT